ncbi:MAG: hypothetical protein HFI81_03595 [Eubacterium sp.]|nr:hypothetical protein [Eubacterium sp.]
MKQPQKQQKTGKKQAKNPKHTTHKNVNFHTTDTEEEGYADGALRWDLGFLKYPVNSQESADRTSAEAPFTPWTACMERFRPYTNKNRDTLESINP